MRPATPQRLVAAGRSNQRIADELVIVLDTAKKHVGHILDKLGAANRTQAVARARELELLRWGAPPRSCRLPTAARP